MSCRDMNVPMRNNKSELPKQTVHSSARVLPNARMVRSNSYGSKKQYCASNENSVAQVHHYVSSGTFSEPYFDHFQHWTSQNTWPMYTTQYSQMAQVQPYFQQFGLHSKNGFPDLLEAISPSGIIQNCRMHLLPGMQLGNRHNGGFYDHFIDTGSSKHMSQLGIGSEDNSIPLLDFLD